MNEEFNNAYPTTSTRATKRSYRYHSRTTASTPLSRRRTSSASCIESKGKNEKTADHYTVWKNLTSWITSNGGYVHPCLKFRTDDRRLHFSSMNSTDDGDIITAGTKLVIIPNSCLLTMDIVMQSKIGPQLNKAIDDIKLINSDKISKKTIEFLRVYRDDLLLSFYMATLMEGARNDDAIRFYGPYLDSLPPSETCNTLPRRWSEEKLKCLLGGTSLYHRVVEEKANLQSIYDSTQILFHKTQEQNEEKLAVEFPSFAVWDDMYAAVSSRGFAGMGCNSSSSNNNSEDAMVRLLDLLDHKRGEEGKRNVRYTRKESENDEEKATVEVTCDNDILPNVPICDTYGAKGNSQLLCRYGFCIPNNIEPDGSSNDVLELRIQKDLKDKISPVIVELRAGPKSYTYGGFVKALEHFYPDSTSDMEKNDLEQEEDGDDDMEAFLNQCEEDEYCHSCEVIPDPQDEGDFDGTPSNNNIDEDELIALKGFIEALQEVRNSFQLEPGATKNEMGRDNNHISDEEHFASLLILSELRTINLFQQAAREIHHLLHFQSKQTNNNEGKYNHTKISTETETSNDVLFTDQISQLVKAYITIRHPYLDMSSRS